MPSFVLNRRRLVILGRELLEFKFLKEQVCLGRNLALTPKPGTRLESLLLPQVSRAKAVVCAKFRPKPTRFGDFGALTPRIQVS